MQKTRANHLTTACILSGQAAKTVQYQTAQSANPESRKQKAAATT